MRMFVYVYAIVNTGDGERGCVCVIGALTWQRQLPEGDNQTNVMDPD